MISPRITGRGEKEPGDGLPGLGVETTLPHVLSPLPPACERPGDHRTGRSAMRQARGAPFVHPVEGTRRTSYAYCPWKIGVILGRMSFLIASDAVFWPSQTGASAGSITSSIFAKVGQ